MINMFGLFGGIVIGAALIGLLEYRDGSFRTDDDVTSVLKVAVLAVVPLMRSEPERKKLLRRRIVVGAGLSATVLGCLAVVVYTFVR
jgi:hypothetical protein